MIIDLQKFINQEEPYWKKLEEMLISKREGKVAFSIRNLREFNYLYERIAGDLIKLSTYSGEKELLAYLEKLTASAYSEIHSAQTRRVLFNPMTWLISTFPKTFRRNINTFLLAFTMMLAGTIFGGIAVLVDSSAKEAIIPAQFAHVMQSPEKRVESEEKKTSGEAKELDDHAVFASQLMVNNIRVSILAMALGMTFGLGTCILMFYNGAIMGVIAVDFIQNGQTAFLLGWLLPHGAFEIPAIIIAGQAGLIIGSCLLNSGKNRSKIFAQKRMDLVHLIGGVAVILVWAGIVEAFFSQYHEPVLPYSIKISFGVAELILLTVWLGLGGTKFKREVVDE